MLIILTHLCASVSCFGVYVLFTFQIAICFGLTIKKKVIESYFRYQPLIMFFPPDFSQPTII
jgi:hypothetical protein